MIETQNDFRKSDATTVDHFESKTIAGKTIQQLLSHFERKTIADKTIQKLCFILSKNLFRREHNSTSTHFFQPTKNAKSPFRVISVFRGQKVKSVEVEIISSAQKDSL